MQKHGIYKIISPSEKIYVGQTVNFYRRIDFYKNCRCKTQKKLYNSIKKYGWENHIFEILEECEISKLNEREKYWQDFYDVLGEKGLNCRLTTTEDKTGKLSEETKNKIRMSWKNRVYDKSITYNKNRVVKLSSRLKQSNSRCIFTESERIDIWNMIKDGKSFKEIQLKYPIYNRKQHFAISKGKIWNLISGLDKNEISKNENKFKKVICTETNTIYNNSKEAYLILYKDKFSFSYFKCMLSGHNKNITSIKYL